MAMHKILIDYSEYMRLKACEEKCESLNKKIGSNLQGHGDLSTIISENEERHQLETPLLGTSPAITTPLNAQTEEDPGLSLPATKIVKSPTEGQTTPSTQTTSYKWYYLGYPTRSTDVRL